MLILDILLTELTELKYNFLLIRNVFIVLGKQVCF